jgi:GNAT superfamily N-acetyltransferase
MKLRSLGYQTDLIFPAFDGVIVDRGDYLVIRSPLNPTFYWGNFLLFARPPQEGDFDRWRQAFVREIGAAPEVQHQAFGWDSPEGDTGIIDPFLRAGFSASNDVVLTASAPHSPAMPSSVIRIQLLSSASDWAQVIDLQVLCREPEHEEAAYREFRQRAMDRYRRMEAAGLGHWYGAFVGDRLVANMGVFHNGRSLGRYQSVETDPEFRRQGIAGTLVYETGRQAISSHGLHTLVIIAEEGSAPARLYQSVGFTPAEKSMGLLWFPHAGQPATGNC